MQKIAELIPSFIGGSADLKPSTNTYLDAYDSVQADSFKGRNFHYGIREHAMGSVNNGIALYGYFIPFGSTFLVFSDYMRPSIRLAAIMNLQNIFVYTHDSIFVGEDGPTHQPVEHLAALRVIPKLTVLRPADGIETALCWAMAIRKSDGPSAILLTRQNVNPIERTIDFNYSDVNKGGYLIKKETKMSPKVAILASGSEVNTAIRASEILEEKNIPTRVISVPCKELFETQNEDYLRSLLPTDTLQATVIVEAGISYGWEKYLNIPQLKITVDEFGVSGPYKELEKKYGLTGDSVADRVIQFLE
jgi:transketolase